MRTSPADGEGEVAVTRETILEFSGPLDPATISASAFFARFGGNELVARIHLSPDKKRVTLFYTDPLPASARVRVTVDGSALKDTQGMAVDVDGDGTAGGSAIIDFDTLSLSRIPNTDVWGHVYDSYNKNSDGSDRPVVGATIRVDGLPEANAVTDANGYFILKDMPAPAFFVHVDGSTATNAPARTEYATVGKLFHSIPGRSTQLAMDGETFNIYLPPMNMGDLQHLSAVSNTEVTFGEAGKTELSEMFPQIDPDVWDQTMVMFPPNSAVNDSGQPATQAAIIPVPSDRLPAPLPSFMKHQLDIAVISPGASNFDEPAPACFPNLPDPETGLLRPPGTKSALTSFNHDTGRWEIIGPMTVSDNGQLVCTDPGVGILAPGWHGETGGIAPQPIESLPPPDRDDWVHNPDKDDCYRRILVFLGQCVLLAGVLINVDRLRGGIILILCIILYLILFQMCEELPSCLPAPPSVASSASFRFLASSIVTSDISTGDPTADEISVLLRQAVELIYPFVVTGESIPEATLNQIDNLIAQMNAVAGGDAVQYMRDLLLQREEENVFLERSFGNAPSYPVLFAARMERSNGQGIVVRGQTGPDGQYSLFVPRNGNILGISFYDPLTNSLGFVAPNFRPDAAFRLPRFYLNPVDETFSDFDDDGLVDIVEAVYGTESGNPDTDGDGIKDGPEVDQGTNPLDGLPVVTGIIASADTPGTAVDICAVNDLAAVADSEAGVSVFSVINGSNPTIIAQVDTSGSAQAVACAGDLVAAATGGSGLSIIDIRDPPAAQIIHQLELNGSAQVVTTSGGVAYVGLDTGQVVLVDLATGALLDQVQVSGTVQDIAQAGNYLYVLTPDKLHTIFLLESELDVTSTASYPYIQTFPLDRRLFVGGGIAYAAHGNGYSTFGLADPAQPVLITAGATGQRGWRQIVANGSGLGVAPVSINVGQSGNVNLYDVSDPAQTDVFLTTFETPGDARAVSIYNGLAYVADGEAGLQVINYLAYDALGVPPTIGLSTNFAPGLAEEGQVMRVAAEVSDDVQVRNVEFYVDGTEVAIDGNFPFGYDFVTPLIAQQPSFTLRARATDTGGNATWTELMTINLTSDATPPEVPRHSPKAGSILAVGSISSVSATFSEPIDLTTLNNTTFQLFSAGPDGVTGNGDDLLFNGGTVSYHDEVNTALLTFHSALPADLYRVVLNPTIADRVGNTLAADVSWNFRVKDPVYWISDADGFWDEVSNWSTGALPQADDIVIINRPAGDYTITHRSGATVIYKLESEEAFVISGGTLSLEALDDPSRINNDFTLSGTSINGEDLAGPGDLIIEGVFIWTSGEMSGNAVTLAKGGLEIDGTTRKFLARKLENAGDATWRGMGEIWASNPGPVILENLAGAIFEIQNDTPIVGGNGTFNNAGTIIKSASTDATQIDFEFNNNGMVEVRSGTLRANGGGVNTGTFESAVGATFNIASNYTLTTTSVVTGSGIMHLNGANVEIGGTYDLDGLTVIGMGATSFDSRLPARTTNLALSGGTLTGSNDVVVDGTMNLSSGRMSGSGRTVANGTLEFSEPGVTLDGRTLENNGAATWSGTGEFNRGNISGSNGSTLINRPGATFDITGDALLFDTTIGMQSTFINQGTLTKSGSGGSTTVSFVFENSGSVDVISGTLGLGRGGSSSGHLVIQPNGAFVFSASGRTFDMAVGSSVTGDGTVGVTHGIVKVMGVYNVAGDTEVTQGTANFATNATFGNLLLSRTGTITSNATLMINDLFTWSGGTMSGSGRTVANGGIEISGNGRLIGRTLDNVGTAIWIPDTGSPILSGDSLFNNLVGATFDIQGDGTLRGSGNSAFNNQGTLVKSAGGGSFAIGSALTNTGSIEIQTGTLSVSDLTQTAGTTQLSGGKLFLACCGQLNFQGGALSGSGTIEGRVMNAAQIYPGGVGASGTITVTQGYNQATTGTLNIELGGLNPGVEHDQFIVNGNGTLNGTLDVGTINGFTPSGGESFQVMTYGSHTGVFSSINGNGQTYTPNYSPNNLTLIAQ